ncbi:LysR substrate-binding domain-containing protein [Nocardia sp. NBC_01377]|uniref:LysR substrate-binding domain-containing protein n=1 Tax=Nocardia sp. NBC_01377 TaxID=2903595 RepID=UPI00324880A3
MAFVAWSFDREARRAVRRGLRFGPDPTLGFWLAPGQEMLGGIIETFAAVHPDTQLDLRRADWSEKGAGVESGESDIGLIWLPSDQRLRRLKFHRLGLEPMVVALPAGHRLTARERLGPADLAAETMFAVPLPGASTFHRPGREGERGQIRTVTTIRPRPSADGSSRRARDAAVPVGSVNDHGCSIGRIRCRDRHTNHGARAVELCPRTVSITAGYADGAGGERIRAVGAGVCGNRPTRGERHAGPVTAADTVVDTVSKSAQ